MLVKTTHPALRRAPGRSAVQTAAQLSVVCSLLGTCLPAGHAQSTIGAPTPAPCDPKIASCAPGTTPAPPPASCGPANGGNPSCGASSAASQGNSSGTQVGAGNPINLITGNKYQQEVDMPALPGVLGLELIRHYNSAHSHPGSALGLIGRGWRLSYETTLYPVGNTLQIVQADGKPSK